MSAWRQQLRNRWNQLCRAGRLLLKHANDWLLGRAPRERAILAGALFFTRAAIWFQAVFAPQAAGLAQLNNNLAQLEREQADLNATLQSLEARQAQADNPDAPVREEIAETEAALEQLQTDLVNSGLDFISPVTMDEAMRALRNLLEAPEAPALLRFERRRGPGIAAGGDSAVRELDILHREIALVFEADFATTTRFLKSLEADRQRLVWRRLDYQVTDHPTARINLRFDLYAPAKID